MQIWNLGATEEDRQIGQELRGLLELLETVAAEAERLKARCDASTSNQVGEEMAAAGIDDPPTLGFRRSGALFFAVEGLREHVGNVRRLAGETAEDL